VTSPSLELESRLLERYSAVIGVDEVGRGAIAGPVTVGAALFTPETSGTLPTGLKDSKLIPEAKRSAIALESAAWVAVAQGSVSAAEIERAGLVSALQRAAIEAINAIAVPGAVILLDGSQNFLAGKVNLPVVLKTKADRDCGVVAAAALSAKVARDQVMIRLHKDFQEYHWESNKGYASASHIAALQRIGPCSEHRVSWLGKILGSEQLF